MLTPNGFEVMVLHLRISFRRSSGVGWVRAVRSPRPPALETAEASSAYPTHCMPPWTMGTLIPSARVSFVLKGILFFFLLKE